MLKRRHGHRRIHYVWLAISILILLSSVGISEASIHYSLNKQSQSTVSSPDVILQDGSAGTSTIYANSTSAETSIEASLSDYVDNNNHDADSNADKGMHSNFTAEQAGPDSTYDTLKEENTEAIEDYVDNDVSDVDNSADKGTLSDFDNMKTKDGMANLTEVAGGIPTDLQVPTTCMDQMWNQGPDYEWYSAWTPPGSGTVTVTKLWFWDGDGTVGTGETIYMAMYEDGGGYSKLSGSDTTLTGTGSQGWLSADVSTSFEITLGTTYWIGATCASGDTYNICRDDGANSANYPPNGVGTYYQTNNYVLDSSVPTGASQSTNKYIIPGITYTTGTGDYELDQEVQFTNIIDFLPSEKLCIYTGTLGNEDLRVDYWNGTGWENLATDLAANSCNEYTVSLTSTTFTVRFKGGNEAGDMTQDQWQIDASLLRVEGAGDKEDAVDNDTSDEDSSSDFGVLTDFTNMTAYDANMANLTETTLGLGGDWGDTNNPGGTSAAQTTARAMGGTSPNVDNMILTSISVWWGGTGTGRLAVYQGGSLDNPTGATLVWDAGEVAIPATAGWVTISGGSASLAKNEVTWIAWKCDDANYYYQTAWDSASDFQSARGRAQLTAEGADSADAWDATIGTFSFDNYWYDMYINYTVPSDYQLDQEVQWTDIPYSLPNENLSIYGGTMGAEDIEVDVWNGTAWENVFTDLSSGWNNVSITNWLTNSNFTIRFKGGNETGDATQDTWQIDVALVHLWYDGGENYEVDLEVQWTSADYTRTNEELCIRTGTFSGSEEMQVRIWNATGSSWHWVMNLTASQWNNVSITSYLTSSNFTVQFLGGTETGDTNQDSWNIDATLLHLWSSEPTYNYVDNNTSDVDSTVDIGTHSNFTAQQSGPDLITDTLTEGGGGTVWLWQEDTSGYTATSSYETFEFWNSWTTNATTSGSVTKLGIYVFANPGNSPQVKLGIYDDSGGSPNNLLGETNAATITSAGWLDLDIVGGGVSISSSTTYHIAHITDIAPTTQWRYYKTATPVSDYRNNRVWPSLFDPAGATTKSASYRYGAYRVGYDESFRLDLEVQWTSADYTRTNEELCIRTGTFSGSEEMQVRIWNATGSSWHWVMNLTASQWNNVSIEPYLISSILTIQFLGATETGDISQDSWSIDATLLHVWTEQWGTWSDELLVNPSFEMGNLTGWTAMGPAAASVGVFNATSGGDIYTNRSLRIGDYGVCTLDSPGTNDDSGVWQNVSLASYASAIDSGNAVINVTAWLYPSEWDWDDVALIVRFYNSSGGFIGAWNTTGEYGSGSAYYPQAWMLGQGESHFTEGQLEKFGCYNYTIPVGTRTAGIQLGMGEHKDTFYCGGQADEASIKICTRTPTLYDYVLRVDNTVTDSWQIRLTKYSDSNISRLQNCTIYFRNSTGGTSSQITIENGLYTNQTGPWYDLGNSGTICIAMIATANSSGKSYVNTYLEIRIPGTTTYLQYIIAFEIT